MLLRTAAFLFCCLIAFSVHADNSSHADDYAEISLLNFVHTLVRFNVIDTNDDALLDDYALITDCDLVENFYENDFRWSQVRSLIRESIKININDFPTSYHYDTSLQLSRYDFKGKNFRFTEQSALHNVNTFSFTFTYKGSPTRCGDKNPAYIPTAYNIVIGTPVSINGLPFSEQDAKDLLQRLEATGDTDRTIYVRFNMTIIFIEPLRKSPNPGVSFYSQQGNTTERPIRIDARLDSVEFFEDADHTKKLYSFTP